MILRSLLKLIPEKLRHRIVRRQIRLGHGAPTHIIFKMAETQEELEQAFQVLHDAYVSQGYMDPQPSGLRVTKYHALPTTAVLIAKDLNQNKVVATISIVRNTPLGLPLDAVFNLETLKNKYRHFAEVSSLAVRADYRKDPRQMLWPLLRYFYAYIRDVMRVDAYVIGVNPSWHDLYTGILSFTKLKGFHADSYGFVNNAPVAAYVVDVIEQEFSAYKYFSHLPDRCNFFKYTHRTKLSRSQHYFPHRRYHSIQSTVMTKEFFDYFFVKRTNALSLLTDEEKVIVQHYYPIKEFSKILFNGAPTAAVSIRGANRFITRFTAQMKVEDNYENDLELSIIDFSATGLRIESNVEIPYEVDLRIAIGKYDSSYVRAQIRRRFTKSYGLEIVSHDHAWTEFIEEMQKQFKLAEASSSNESTNSTVSASGNHSLRNAKLRSEDQLKTRREAQEAERKRAAGG